MSPEKRKAQRKRVYSKVVFVDFNIPGYIRNMNTGGLGTETLLPFPIAQGSVVRVELIPVEELGMKKIPLAVVIRWVNHAKMYTSIGLELFSIGELERRSYDRLVDYYRDQSSSDA